MPSATVLYDVSDHAVFTIAKEHRIEVPLAEVSPNLIKAVVAIEDRRFFDHDGFDPIRIAGSALADLTGRRGCAGRQHDHATAGPPIGRTAKDAAPQGEGTAVCGPARTLFHEERDPRALPEQGLLRRRPVRRRGCRARVLWQAGVGVDAARSGAAGRAVEGAIQLRANRQCRQGRVAPGRGAEVHARLARHHPRRV